MQVTYGLIMSNSGLVVEGGDISRLTLRNITVNIGCSCSYFVPIMFNSQTGAQDMEERKKK